LARFFVLNDLRDLLFWRSGNLYREVTGWPMLRKKRNAAFCVVDAGRDVVKKSSGYLREAGPRMQMRCVCAGARSRQQGERSMPDEEKIYDDALEIERHPGRKHTRAEIRKLRAALKGVYKYGDEREFMQFLRGIGLKDESPQFAEIVALFRSLRHGKT
jgi:hypothetical protein